MLVFQHLFQLVVGSMNGTFSRWARCLPMVARAGHADQCAWICQILCLAPSRDQGPSLQPQVVLRRPQPTGAKTAMHGAAKQVLSSFAEQPLYKPLGLCPWAIGVPPSIGRLYSKTMQKTPFSPLPATCCNARHAISASLLKWM